MMCGNLYSNYVKQKLNKTAKRAGKDWLKGYTSRHPDISVRIPEATSIQRAIYFNRAQVDRYMQLLHTTIFDDTGKRVSDEGNIFKVDESGYTIYHKPGKVLAQKGKKGIGAITSVERGKNVTVVACVSATGSYVPPMMIFARVRMKPELLDGSPPGTVGYASKSGWINAELFECWVDHFIKVVQPTHRASKVLLILDGHSSHTKNVRLIEKATANNQHHHHFTTITLHAPTSATGCERLQECEFELQQMRAGMATPTPRPCSHRVSNFNSLWISIHEGC